MTIEPDFTPEFGPNGAVMNAPTMTTQMWAKLEEASAPLTLQSIAFGLSLLVLLGLAAASSTTLLAALHSLQKSSPWWAGVITGAVAMLALSLFWHAVRRGLSRWEIARSDTHALTAPLWMRLLLFLTEVFRVAAYGGALVVLVSNPDMENGSSVAATGIAVLLMTFLHSMLRKVSGRQGWIVKPA